MRGVELGLCGLTFLVFGLNMFVNYYVGSGGHRFGLNFSSIGDVSGQFETDITPAGWTFSIWGLIYLWQILLQIYLGLNILCRGSSSSPLSIFNCPFPYLSLFYIAYIINYLSTIAWVFTWCLAFVDYASPFITLTPICLWFTLGIALKGSSVTKKQQNPSQSRKQSANALTILFVHNGIGLYATWTAIATMINLTIMLKYSAGVAMATACVVALSILSALTLVWFALDVGLLRETAQYLLTPYCVLVFALIGSLAKNWDDASVSAIFSAVLLGVGALMLVVKLVLIAVVGCKNFIGEKSAMTAQKDSEKQMIVAFESVEK